MSIVFSSLKVGQKPRKHGEAKRAWEANEPCRKACGKRPDGRTFGSWKVHETNCRGPKGNENPNR